VGLQYKFELLNKYNSKTRHAAPSAGSS